ncbi:LLM class F420-dependent oxidoreductase [Streptomyces alkaliphilus]|uniref:TIGR03560 family F420-dependent LLM class oxidoreductase n=1 Tax=Streptomyces alkaliphilus TaxID=1472722 RepID=A0A7W3T9F9_9ACTN|nr:LLM class F420-dependent oxidoreductase [Streptomyces alkaliphilus]MBB0242677.1 TIGR03560 family F420-dependent LLM class oxidoreductase [Streptomyces alkaliphilus]MQS06675.1 TIGR03560 family F420-dependent LLM class oxidoreductase [Streptomyces alkaliphilus]
MKIGLAVADFAWEGGAPRMAETLAALSRSADDAGFDVIGVADHVWQGPHMGGPEEPMLECFTTLATVAAHTRSIRVMPLVAGVHFRPPGLLAKTLTTLDVLSGGRADLGIGAGWYEEEARGLGIDFPSLTERFERLEETVRICLSMWEGERGDEKPFEGEHYRLERPLNVPQNPGRPKIMIGGGGEKKTLRLVARYADACNLYPGPELPGKLEVLRGHCETEGRDYDAIEKTCIMPFAVSDGASADELVGTLRELGGLGVQRVIGIPVGADRLRQVDLIGERVLAAVADA